MSSLYPSLEDMKVDQISKAQHEVAQQMFSGYPSAPHMPSSKPVQQMPSSNQANNLAHLYPSLQDYMGLELTQELIAANVPGYSAQNTQSEQAVSLPHSGSSSNAIVAPLLNSGIGIQKANVNHGIRQATLCKDGDGRIGIRVKAINKGIFVCFVKKNSPAALAGLRFGDQILQINDVNVAGYTMDKVHGIFRKCASNGIILAIRDRPFERMVTLYKDSTGHVGFMFKDGEINAIVKDSSAARNGLLTEHQILEVDGQNVVGVKDKEINALLHGSSNSITLTIMPAFIYKHMLKHMASSLTKFMDHSVPDI